MFIVFTAYPIVMSYVYAFFNWSGIGPMNQFVGWQNFANVTSDPVFWSDFRHSMIYMIGQTVCVIPTTFFIALLVNQKWLKGRAIYRTILFLPVVTTTAIVGIVMQYIFGNQNALVNDALLAAHLIHQSIPWLGEPNTAMGVLIVVGSWKYFGIVMVYWLAGFQSLPEEVFESAKIDGANFFQSLWHITLPLLKPVAAVILLLTVVNGLFVFDLVETLTGGGPYYGTETVDVYIYRYAFASGGFPRIGYASAAAVLYGITITLISLMIGIVVKLANAPARGREVA